MAVIGYVGFAALVAAYALLFFTCGREYRTPGLGRYLADPDGLDLPPALVGYVWRMGHVSSHDVAATLLDLIDRGLIGLDDPVRPRTLLLPGADADPVMPHERALLSLLQDAAQGDRMPIGGLADYAKHEPQQFMERMYEFKEAIVTWASASGVFEGESERWLRTALGIAWLTCVWTFVTALAAKSPWLALGVPASVVMIVCAGSMRRRSRPFADVRNKAEALHRYLRDFGRMSDKRVGAVVLWSRYLVFAEEFGMADHVRDGLLRHAGDQVGLFGSLTSVLDTMPVLPFPRAAADGGMATRDDPVAARTV